MPTRRLRPVYYPLLLLVLLLSSPGTYAHKQPVHHYIAREGYSLLLQRVGYDIPALSAAIGLADPSFAGDSAWQKGYITTGAWREDEEDVVYHYDILPGLNYALTSITHFWDADQGDLNRNQFRLMVERPPLPPIITDIGPYQNAYDKMLQFAHGGWTFWYPRTIICQNSTNNHFLVITPVVAGGGFGIPLEYKGLTTFYITSKLKVRADQIAACVVFDVNDLKTISLSDVVEIEVADDVRNTVLWEVLGRMCHLLGDMSIPAHAHRDEHGLTPDSYEDYVGGAGDPYRQWHHGNAGAPILLNGPTDEVLHFLMYIMQQQADHFGSNGPADGAGNNILGGDPSRAEIDFLNAINLASLAGPIGDAGPWTAENLHTIADKTIPMAIRTTAGLLYWFCHETGLVETIPGIATGVEEATHAAVFTLMQNYPNPFNPRTVIRFSVPTQSGRDGQRPALSGVQESGASDVKLTVSDILGKEVAVLLHERKAPGTYQVEFDASGLASGTYIYRLTAGSYVEARRMSLIK